MLRLLEFLSACQIVHKVGNTDFQKTYISSAVLFQRTIPIMVNTELPYPKWNSRVLLLSISSPWKFMKNKTKQQQRERSRKSKNKSCPFGELLFEKSLASLPASSSDCSQDDSSFTFLDLSRLQSSSQPTTPSLLL